MDEVTTLVLLPGLDGSGESLARLVPFLDGFDVHMCTYANDVEPSYEAYLSHIKEQLPDGPYIAIGESFGGRLAMMLMQDEMAQSTILISSFITPPLWRPLRPFARFILPALKWIPVSKLIVKFMLFDRHTPNEELSDIVKNLPSQTMIDRLTLVLSEVAIPESHKPFFSIHGRQDRLVRQPIAGSEITKGPHALAYCYPEAVAQIIFELLGKNRP